MTQGDPGQDILQQQVERDADLIVLGKHGAFTWGVLDRLLEEEQLEIASISGTSAGAMNAVALAAGLMDDGRAGARRVLSQLWTRVAESSPFHPWQSGPLAATFGPASTWLTPWIEPFAQAAAQWSSRYSPYQRNPPQPEPAARDPDRDHRL